MITVQLSEEEWELLFAIFDHFIHSYPGPLSVDAQKLIDKLIGE